MSTNYSPTVCCCGLWPLAGSRSEVGQQISIFKIPIKYPTAGALTILILPHQAGVFEQHRASILPPVFLLFKRKITKTKTLLSVWRRRAACENDSYAVAHSQTPDSLGEMLWPPDRTVATPLREGRGSRSSPLPLITNARLFRRKWPAGFRSSLGINENPTTSCRQPQTMQRHGVPHTLQGTVGHSELRVPWRPKSKCLACHLMDTWRKTPWWARSQCPLPADYHFPPGESRQRNGKFRWAAD